MILYLVKNLHQQCSLKILTDKESTAVRRYISTADCRLDTLVAERIVQDQIFEESDILEIQALATKLNPQDLE